MPSRQRELELTFSLNGNDMGSMTGWIRELRVRKFD